VIEALRGENFRNVVNLPFPDGVDYRSLAPYMNLAEKIGSLLMQLIRGRISRVEVEFRGEEVESSEKPLTVALLKGFAHPDPERGRQFRQRPQAGRRAGDSSRPPAAPRSRRVFQYHSLPGPFHQGNPPGRRRPVPARPAADRPLLDDYRIDALPSGPALILSNRDIPGVIGKVGTLLGERGINIAEWQMGRSAPGGSAVSYINIDTPASEEI